MKGLQTSTKNYINCFPVGPNSALSVGSNNVERNRSSLLKMDSRSSLRSAPGHPVKYLLHRSSLDLGPNYRNYANWQFDKAKSLYRKNLFAHFGCVNAIEFSKNGNLLVSAGDDRRVLLWNVDKAIVSKEEPHVMQAEHLSNVFSLDFSCSAQRVFSAGNDDQVIVHDTETCAPVDYFPHEQPVYGISADPFNDSLFCSACDDGRILIYDIRESGNDPFCVAKATSAFHSVMFNPIEPRLIVSSNSKEGVSCWDIRMPKRALIKYGVQNSSQCCMNARFNRLGSQILVLRRRLPPILYSTDSPSHLYQFNHRGYYNSCTMKSCSFGGMNDQFVLSGSDNFDLHLWKIPPPGSDQWVNKANMVLRGHRSIVNQVRFNYTHNLIASSGVEKIVKLWSPFPLPDELGGRSPAVVVNESERRIYTPDDYVHLVMQAGSGNFMSLTYEAGRKTTREDSRMLAFFDALVQRDINGMSSEDSDDFPETSYTNTVNTSPETSSSDNEDDDSNPPNYRSLLPPDPADLTQPRQSRSGQNSHNEAQSTPADRSSSPPSLTNTDRDLAPRQEQEPVQTEDSEIVNESTTREVSEHQPVANREETEATEDRDMTANMITQLILQKENNRRKLIPIKLSACVKSKSSNRAHHSETESESQENSTDENKTTSKSSSNLNSTSSSRPLRLSEESRRRRSTTSSYSSTKKEFRKQMLRKRKRDMLSAPVYDSSRNFSDSHSSTTTLSSLETSYDRINHLMTRTQTTIAQTQATDSSGNSSSSSSSDSSSSDDSKACKNGDKKAKKILISGKKSRAIISSGSSSTSESSRDCTSASNPVLDTESSASSSPPPIPTSSSTKDTKRKRRHPCKLNEACKALFKKYTTPSPGNSATPIQEPAVSPYKRLRLQQLSESASTSSADVTNEPVSFKKFSKQKDRNYRKFSGSDCRNTPPDSGIDLSKEQEPCCSKSCEESSLNSKSRNVRMPKQVEKKTKVNNESNGDDQGFGQTDSEESD